MRRLAILLLLAVAALAVAACGDGSPAPLADRIDAEEVLRVIQKDGIASIDEPEFDRSEEADFMWDEEFVLGVEIQGDARAYPLDILARHEIVNDVVGGQPIAVTW